MAYSICFDSRYMYKEYWQNIMFELLCVNLFLIERLQTGCPWFVLQNMVGRGEVDEDLEGETKEECEKYGKVVKCVIFEVREVNLRSLMKLKLKIKLD